MTSGHEHRLQLRDITKRYGGEVVLEVPELDVRDGEFFTLLGPSGSGKTTTLKLIAGFEEPTTGDILVHGRSFAGVPVEKRDIGVVFQNYALFPHLSVAQNIAFPLQMRRLPKADVARRIDQVLDLVDLGAHRDKRASMLSGGQQQRVAIARAIVFEPELLLMDEPLGALDRKLRHRLQIELRALQQQLGITVVYVTHDQDEAMSMSDRVAIMRAGRIEQVGASGTLYDAPETLFVSNFLGDNNVIEGVVESADSVRVAGDRIVRTRPHSLPAGERASVTIRPERVRISADPAGAVDGDRFDGTVLAVVPYGAITSYELDLGGGRRVQSNVHHTGDHLTAAVGDRVVVSWSPTDVLAFPAEPVADVEE
ncbi:MAG: hypothetical protein BGO95_05640 [Micrococcales bacterium 73-13]|nr:MAG: hypothetical protein BGO95_05640 [Micrococcales bacterium 73-13]